MKLKRLYIGDMGIYRNALIEDVSPKIVVIGGLNRSGKTTLLEVLRHMAYGFPKGLREVKTEYFVEGDLIDEQSTQYTVKLMGQREPQISSNASDGTSLLNGLYGNIDKFTYSQLYTITLDELKRSNVKSDEEKLQSVLLGAGLKDIVHLPKLVEEFKKEKEKIGGKQGSLNTKLFKPYYEKLLDGIDDREKALKQLEEYENKYKTLKALEDEIGDCDKLLLSLNQKVAALEVVKAYYKQYEEKKALEIQLEAIEETNTFSCCHEFPSLERVEAISEEYQELLNEYERLKEEFYAKVSSDKEVYDKLLQASEQIRNFQKQLSGLLERVENNKTLKSDYDRTKEQIRTRMNSLNSFWKGDFLKIINIDCDSIEQDKLLTLIDELNDLEAERKQGEAEASALRLQKEMLEKEVRSLKSADLGAFIIKYLYASLGVLLAGVLLFMLSKPLGGAAALVGAVSVCLYFVIRYSSENQLQARKNSLKLQLNTLESRLKPQEEKVTSTLCSLKDTKAKLDFYKNKLELNREISPVGLLQYFKDVKELKKDILNLGFSGKNLDRLQQELKIDLLKINNLVGSLTDEQVFKEQDILNFSGEIRSKLEKISEQLAYAEKLAECEARLFQVENKIGTLLKIDIGNVLILKELDKIIKQYKIYNLYKQLSESISVIDKQFDSILSGERLRKAFTYIYEEYGICEESEQQSLKKLFENFTTEEQLVREFSDLNAKLQDASARLESLKEEKQALKGEITALRSTQKLIESQRVMDEQRAALKQLAVKYSVYSAAEFILDSVQKNFIDTAKDTILGGAGNIFEKITGGEYKALLPGENLLQTDFKAMLQDGQVQNSVSMLSRGTGEQLYLSVRLSRIKEIKEKLPLILDDPFVNFDSEHVKNALKVICDTAEENQVFILTCHSELVKLIDSISNEVQYWKLNKGSFELSNCNELISYLL